jgi:hypothetical protein
MNQVLHRNEECTNLDGSKLKSQKYVEHQYFYEIKYPEYSITQISMRSPSERGGIVV